MLQKKKRTNRFASEKQESLICFTKMITRIYLIPLILLVAFDGAATLNSAFGASEGEETLYSQKVHGDMLCNTKTFTCKDGSLTLPIQRVNDEYCDCPDGSDEPGTCRALSIAVSSH